MQRTTTRLAFAAAALAAAAILPAHAEGYGRGIVADATTNAQRGLTVQPATGMATREQKREEAAIALRRGDIQPGERTALRPSM